jgi:hypothetical protein
MIHHRLTLPNTMTSDGGSDLMNKKGLKNELA